MIHIERYVQGAVLLAAIGVGILCGRACVHIPPPAVVVPPDTVVIEKPIIVFKDRPELAEKVHLVTKPTPAVPEVLPQVLGTPTQVPSSSTYTPLFRVMFDGEKVFTMEKATVKYGWRGTGNCQVQVEEGGAWLTLGSSELNLQDSKAIAIEALATPPSEVARNRFTLGAGYGNGGWVAAFGASRSLVWKNKFTKAVMPEEIGAMALMHASHDVDVIATGSWRF